MRQDEVQNRIYLAGYRRHDVGIEEGKWSGVGGLNEVLEGCEEHFHLRDENMGIGSLPPCSECRLKTAEMW